MAIVLSMYFNVNTHMSWISLIKMLTATILINRLLLFFLNTLVLGCSQCVKFPLENILAHPVAIFFILSHELSEPNMSNVWATLWWVPCVGVGQIDRSARYEWIQFSKLQYDIDVVVAKTTTVAKSRVLFTFKFSHCGIGSIDACIYFVRAHPLEIHQKKFSTEYIIRFGECTSIATLFLLLPFDFSL